MSRNLSPEEIGNIIYKNRTLYMFLLRKHIYNESNVEDAFNSTAFNMLKKEITEETAKAYLSQSFVNAGIDVSRKKMHSKVLYADLSAYEHYPEIEEESDDVDLSFLADKDINIVDYVKNILTNAPVSEESISLLKLRYFEGLSFPEIGEIYGVLPGTAKSKVNRALRMIKLFIDSGCDKSKFQRGSVIQSKKAEIELNKQKKIEFYREILFNEAFKISNTCRKILEYLVYMKDSYSEAANELGIDERTITQTIYHAKKQYKQFKTNQNAEKI